VVDRIVLVRHGETEWSRTLRHTGRTDVPLTSEGRRQATQTAARLAGTTWSLVLTSPLQRAVETCRLSGLGDRAEIDPDLQEWDYGDYDGLTKAEIAATRPTWWLWTDGCPGGEQPADVARRADRALTRCKATAGDVALFSHGHFLRVLASRWVETGPQFGAHLALSTAAISVVSWERDTPVISGWNDTTHLRLG
jgi:broad specificity phosphatase PhoE